VDLYPSPEGSLSFVHFSVVSFVPSITFNVRAVMTSRLAAFAICLIVIAWSMGCAKPVNDQPEFRLTEPPTQESG
jgi:hypothetical protein